MDDNLSQHQPQKRVVVCGGGIIGVCTAYFLSKKGAAVTLIERSSIACAASGKAGGFLALHMCDDGPLSSLARTSFDLHRSLAEELNGAQSYGYRPLTAVTVNIDESEQMSNNSNILPPWVDGGVKPGEIIGATETTAQIHPQLFTRALLAKAVAEYGVKVVVGKVKSVATEGDGVVVNVDSGGVIVGDAVVLALGPWTSKLPEMSDKFRVYGKKVHSVILEPKDADAITAHALFGTYYPVQGADPIDPEVYPRPTGEVYICGPSVEAEIPDGPELVYPDPESTQVLKKVAGIVSSHLKEANARVTTEQACYMPCTDDELPIIGEVHGMNKCYVASGHGCWGILFGPATGAAMAELVLDGHASIVNLNCFTPTRFATDKYDI
ncbi:FAD/NAD(P)-binding domain-containing protein [Artemisia annua]|uniref:FAD/NAD(P)-binding domain-containing protein n=1 Tax=Artemisia annua TaxID=35608 RepID=A0A2U1KV21_ARTAN|nr:FAD/NAD(P)-binding domain-containing protein [Artemisia annua]